MNAVVSKPKVAKKVAAAQSIHVTAEPAPITVGTAIRDILRKVQTHYNASTDPDQVCVHGHTLADLAAEEASRLVAGEHSGDDNESLYRIAALLAGAHAHDCIDATEATDRHTLLKQAYDLAESASISFGFVEQPCAALALGIEVGRALRINQGTAQRDKSFDPYCVSMQARDVCRSLAENYSGTADEAEALWAIFNLLERNTEAVRVAVEDKPDDLHAHDRASEELASTIGLYNLLAAGGDLDVDLLYAVETLIIVAKNALDDQIAKKRRQPVEVPHA
jgi:hypothetical protein